MGTEQVLLTACTVTGLPWRMLHVCYPDDSTARPGDKASNHIRLVEGEMGAQGGQCWV